MVNKKNNGVRQNLIKSWRDAMEITVHKRWSYDVINIKQLRGLKYLGAFVNGFVGNILQLDQLGPTVHAARCPFGYIMVQ